MDGCTVVPTSWSVLAAVVSCAASWRAATAQPAKRWRRRNVLTEVLRLGHDHGSSLTRQIREDGLKCVGLTMTRLL